MGEPLRFRPLPWILIALLLSGVGFLILRERRRNAEANEALQRSALEKEARIATATALQVWAAGYRNADGQWCGACSPNPTMLYSTSDPSEVRELLANFRYRRSAPDEPEVGICGMITVLFLEKDKVLASANLKPARLESSSWSFVESWLTKRDLLSRAAAVLAGPRKNP